MEKKEKRPGYFARLKKRRQLRQSQSEKGVTEESQSGPASKGPIICASEPDGIPEGNECRHTARTLSGGSEDNSKPNGQARREKRQPPGTVEYTVGPKDTLNGIALKFNVTPNKLVQLNRLFSRSVVPGQKLFVPDVGQSEADVAANASPDSANPQSRKESLDGKSSSRSGVARRRERSPPSEDESPVTVKFLKMSCKYFTDGMGVVGGVMIVTPNNIMFDPHKSDPLVIEHGCEEYGLICPMEEVLSVALYDDVSRMQLKDALPSPGEWVELPSERDLNPFSRYEALGQPSRPIILDDVEMAEWQPADKSPSDEGFTELELLQNDSSMDIGNAEVSLGNAEVSLSRHQTTGRLHLRGPSSQERSDCERADPRERCLSEAVERVAEHVVDHEEEEDEGLYSRSTNETAELVSDCERSRLLRAGPDPAQNTRSVTGEDKVNNAGPQILTSDASLTEAAATDQNGTANSDGAARDSGCCSSSGPSHQEDKESRKGPNLEEEQMKAEERQAEEMEMKSWLLKRMQAPIEDMLLSTEEKSKNPPMFLCFKVGKPMRKSFASGRTSSPAHSFGTRGKQPEYWFAVPQERVDHLYSFFIQWSPDAYGKDAQEQGFVVVEKDELNMIDNFFSDPVPRSWEIITINEAKRRQSFGSYEAEEPQDVLSILTDPSMLLEDTHVEKVLHKPLHHCQVMLEHSNSQIGRTCMEQ